MQSPITGELGSGINGGEGVDMPGVPGSIVGVVGGVMAGVECPPPVVGGEW